MMQPVRVLAALACVSLALAACSAGDGATGLGRGEARTVVIASELPLQGAAKDISEDTNKAMKLYLEQVGDKAGRHTVTFQQYDNSTAARGQWDAGACRRNAQEHLAAQAEVAVVGPFDTGCAQAMLPVLNGAGGPVLAVSHAATSPGLTREWEPGEPGRYLPSGRRSFARVVTTDDLQGVAAARFAGQKLGAARVQVLHDGQAYGRGVARAFTAEATRQGLQVVGTTGWDPRRRNYGDLFRTVRRAAPDLVFLAGTYDNNGAQLIQDKVAVLGGNDTVDLMASDGFAGYPPLLELPQAEGMYFTFPGMALEQLRQAGGTPARLLADFRARHGADPTSSYALYGVAALQVVLEAVARSDGTRQGVLDALFTGDGVTVPADRSATGQEIRIDPQTGDVAGRDVSVLIVRDGAEVFVQAQPVG